MTKVGVVRPRIAVPTPTSSDLAYNRTYLPQYVAAIEQAGGVAVEFLLGANQVAQEAIAESCDGALLPGSPADVLPERYGQLRDSWTAKADILREAADTLLLEHAQKHGKGVLGICYGLQSINIWRGGTLLQDLAALPVNHSAGPAVAAAHAAAIAPGSLLATLVGEADVPTKGCLHPHVLVNSSHHQGVGILGEGLRAGARCPQDSVVEAIEGDGKLLPGSVLAVQWHPERSYESSALSRALFGWLIGTARR